MIRLRLQRQAQKDKRQAQKDKVGTLSENLVTLLDPATVASEAYRSLRTSLLYAVVDAPPMVLLITSPGPADGKTTTCACGSQHVLECCEPVGARGADPVPGDIVLRVQDGVADRPEVRPGNRHISRSYRGHDRVYDADMGEQQNSVRPLWLGPRAPTARFGSTRALA
jgi:hypothetical protein